ncbi:MAG: hypothetical protein HN509_12420 [Halobacteriovoraceae bacterium]|jgi:hypothetical protein|nr:hypothetical protein [Halobacteriovoraceae bacterium]MBT5094974.1 hypothetical protein [Halobacteriovoraceae bacterium]
MTDSSDQGFNDDELQDIMNEIENLEKEYESPAEETTEPAVEAVAEETTSEAVAEQATVEEVEAVEEVFAEAETATEPESEAEATENVVPISEAPAPAPTPAATATSAGHSMDFAGSGTMDFNLSFHVGTQVANLKIDNENGFTLEMEGMDLTISESEGCVVEMAGGVRFTIPLANGNASSVKKAS